MFPCQLSQNSANKKSGWNMSAFQRAMVHQHSEPSRVTPRESDRGKECRNGINVLRDFAALYSLSFDKFNARRHSEQQPPQTTNSQNQTTTNTHHRNWKAFTARHTTQFLATAVNINSYRARPRLPATLERHMNEHLEAVHMKSLFQPSLLCQSTLLLSLSSVSLISPGAYTVSTWPIDALEAALRWHYGSLYFLRCNDKVD
jgi:hypothetical protein